MVVVMVLVSGSFVCGDGSGPAVMVMREYVALVMMSVVIVVL